MKTKQVTQNGRRRLFAGMVLLLSLLLGACQSQVIAQPVAEVEIPTFIIKTKEYSFDAPQQITAGWITINLENEGEKPHHVQLVRLNDGVTAEQFQTALQEGAMASLALVTFGGGPSVVEPGGSQQVTVNLEPGHYFLLCLIPDHQGVPHLAHGMIAPLEVVSGAEQVPESPIRADAEIRLMNFSFVLPQPIKAGEQIWKVVNNGSQPHELVLIKLAEGKTMADVQHWMHQPEGMPPFINAGGLQGIDPGETAYLHLNLLPGNYLAICHFPDPVSGKEHMELGMILPFAVSQE